MPEKRWPHVRAGAIALVIAIGLVDGCPLPPPAYVLPWQKGYVDVLRPIQRTLLRPFTWVQRVFYVTQRWGLFQAAERDRYRLEIHGRVGETWALLSRVGDPDHSQYTSLLLDERVRGAWNPTDRAMRQYGVFTQWFLGRVLEEHPELDAARIWFERIVIENGEASNTGKYVMPIVRERGVR